MSELKSEEITTEEKGSLHRAHRNLYSYWQERRLGSGGYPKELDESFKLIDQRNSFMIGPDYPKYMFRFLSEFGFLGMNIYVVNKHSGVLIVSNDLHTQGVDGNIRGMGVKGLNETERIMQVVSNRTGLDVVDIAVPNRASIYLLQDDPGYVPFTETSALEIDSIVDEYDQMRWRNLLIQADSFGAMMKRLSPNDDSRLSFHGDDIVAEMII